MSTKPPYVAAEEGSGCADEKLLRPASPLPARPPPPFVLSGTVLAPVATPAKARLVSGAREIGSGQAPGSPRITTGMEFAGYEGSFGLTIRVISLDDGR